MTIINTKVTTIAKHVLFWLVFFIFQIAMPNPNYSTGGYNEIIEGYLFKTILQIILGYTILHLLKPSVKKNKWMKFSLITFILLFIMHTAYILYRINYLEVTYADSYIGFLKNNPNNSFMDRLLSIKNFIGMSIFFLQPTFYLLILTFYTNQQKLLKLNEQKKTNELAMLKHQLNPHFLFNTLNNLYSLTISKSEKAPKIIEKLSDILDYVLYRSSDKFVPLLKEVKLIEDYLVLEKIRYGNRVEINFDKKINSDLKIAPLLLLTFVENAFKHGVTQELDKATISILIKTNNNSIDFYVQNTKPKQETNNEIKSTNGIGIKNVEKQLELLYDNDYDLKLENAQHFFEVNLNVEA